jgi:hypothetical protein
MKATVLFQAAVIIQRAENGLGRCLSRGERSDLILDNMADVPGVEEAHAIVDELRDWEDKAEA